MMMLIEASRITVTVSGLSPRCLSLRLQCAEWLPRAVTVTGRGLSTRCLRLQCAEWLRADVAGLWHCLYQWGLPWYRTKPQAEGRKLFGPSGLDSESGPTPGAGVGLCATSASG